LLFVSPSGVSGPCAARRVPFITVTPAQKPSPRMMGNLVTGPGGDINAVEPTFISISEPVPVILMARQRPKRTDVYLSQWVRDNGTETTEGQPAKL
jgi:hypothetical protein